MTVSFEKAKQYIEQLDLTYIVEMMCSDSYPLPKWIKAEAIDCAERYKNFLLLNKKFYSEPLVPTREIDEFWHNHILFTKHYSEDCLKIFGCYLHHDPAMPGEDNQKLIADYQKTKQLYLQEFNQPLDLIKK